MPPMRGARLDEGGPLRKPRPLRTFALVVAAMVVAWLVLSRTFVAYLAGRTPDSALWLRPDDPQALVTLAERRLDPDRTALEGAAAAPAAPDEVRQWLETALAGDPLNARALRILGQLAAADEGRAISYMQAAARRSVQESLAVHWLMQRHYEEKNYTVALDYADALLRTRPRTMPHVLPMLGKMAETTEARGALEKLLAGNPPWRRAFLSVLPQAVSDARTPLIILLAIRDAPAPPTLADVRGYVGVLLAHKFHELAYYTWLQFLPPEHLAAAGPLFNGSFEFSPSGLPFDWVLSAGRGVTVDIAPRPDDASKRALYIELGPGRVEFQGVPQTLLLSPGTYRFDGKVRAEIAGPRGLVWRVACAGSQGPPLGQSVMMIGTIGAAAAWKEVKFSFTVPTADCRAQQLRLDLDARMASEQLVSGYAWYDDLSLTRED
jgi:hypothetical protein